MKDAYQLLQQKEMELARIRHEIDSLRIVAPLIEDSHFDDSSQTQSQDEEEHSEAHSDVQATGTDGLFSYSMGPRPKIWDVLKRGK
ncbi:MAG: hypothetical protein JOZ36_01315 [Acidobacteria bacterium]|nr:hypothetical protein [Acidobacteriota bacterium]